MGGIENWTKLCSRCKQPFNRTSTNGYCPSCLVEYGREYRKRNAEQIKHMKMLAAHGITLNEYYKLLAKQNGVCAICKEENISKRFRYLTIDHDHETGYIRQLLCTNCNIGLGCFKDNPALLRKAADYIEEHYI